VEGAVEPNRERIEDFMRRFMRRYGYEENRVFRVLAAAVAILLVLRVLRVLAVPVAIGAILVVVGWLLLGPGFPATSGANPPIPRPSAGSLVENGVAVIVACGKKRGWEAVESAPEPRTGTWSVERSGECKVYYHHPPDAYQREQRHQRAH
jgi:hypothetical protein